MTTLWEYDMIEGDANVHQLDEMGADGWELVGFTATPWEAVNERKGYTESGTSYRWVFKRPRLPEDEVTNR